MHAVLKSRCSFGPILIAHQQHPRVGAVPATPGAAGAQAREAPCPAGGRARKIRGEGLGVPAHRLPRGLQGRRPLRGGRRPAGVVTNNSFMPTGPREEQAGKIPGYTQGGLLPPLEGMRVQVRHAGAGHVQIHASGTPRKAPKLGKPLVESISVEILRLLKHFFLRKLSGFRFSVVTS